jgi:8-amino-7-oxononanoate synthase
VGVETVEPAAAVVTAVVGEPRRAVRLAAAVLAGGVRVGCFRPPSVPHGRSCLRLTARANLTSADLELAHRALTGALGSSSVDTSPAVRARDEGADT